MGEATSETPQLSNSPLSLMGLDASMLSTGSGRGGGGLG